MPKKTTPQLSVTPPPSNLEDWISKKPDAGKPSEEPRETSTPTPVVLSGEKERRCTFPLPESLYRKIKIRSATTGEGMQVLFRQAVEILVAQDARR